MSIDIQFTQESGYLSVKASGPYSPSDFQKLADAILSRSSQTKCKRILVDTSGITGDIPNIERYDLGIYVSQLLDAHTLKIAVVAPAKLINKFFENVAVNRGVDVNVVPDPLTAKSWLMEDRCGEADPVECR